MNYSPAITSANAKRHFEVGRYTAVLYDDIESAGAVEYHLILAVFDPNEEPCFFVASEANSMALRFGGGSHFLGVFDGDGHANYGDSDDWADETKFTDEALRIVRARFETKA